jgi:hypothetical protein
LADTDDPASRGHGERQRRLFEMIEADFDAMPAGTEMPPAV